MPKRKTKKGPLEAASGLEYQEAALKVPTPFPALRLAQDELAALRDMTEILIAHPPRSRARMLMWLSSYFREPMPPTEGDNDA